MDKKVVIILGIVGAIVVILLIVSNIILATIDPKEIIENAARCAEQCKSSIDQEACSQQCQKQ